MKSRKMDFSHLVPTAKTEHILDFEEKGKKEARAEDEVGRQSEKAIPFWAENPALKNLGTQENGTGKVTGKIRSKQEAVVHNDPLISATPWRSKEKKSLVLCFDGTGVFVMKCRGRGRKMLTCSRQQISRRL
jgi:hypothetical protein